MTTCKGSMALGTGCGNCSRCSSPQQYDDAHPPKLPGLYYWETADKFGHPQPGFHWQEKDVPAKYPEGPWKMFGPIPGAMARWEMVPLEKA